LPDVKPEPSARVTLLSPGAEPRRPVRYRVAVGTEQSLRFDTTFDFMMSMGEHPMVQQKETSHGRIRVRALAIRGDLIDFELTVVDMETPSYDPTDFKPQPSINGAKGTFTITDRGMLVDHRLPFLETVESREALHLPDYFLVLPEEPVGVGAKWEVRSVQLRNGIGANAVDTHELVALDGTLGRTSSKLVFESWPQLAPAYSTRDPITVFEVGTFRSSGSAETRFDLARAIPEGKTEFEFTTEMSIRRVSEQRKIDMKMSANIEAIDEGHGGGTR
jgi:hypothetical protein